MTRSVARNQVNVSAIVRMITDADGTPATGVVAATGGHAIWYRREGAAVVTDSGSAADLTAITDAHTDWAFKHIQDGYYRVDIPDAAFAENAEGVLIGMQATGISCVAEYLIIDSLIKFSGQAASVTATTTTFPAGTTPRQGDQIYVKAGTGIGQTRLVTSVSGEQATHLAWDVNISDTTSTIVLVPGDETLADGGINVDVASSTLSTLTQAEVNTQVDNALADYDGPTRAELTTDIDSILAKLPSALSASGNIKADVQEINAGEVFGAGVTGNKWRGSA